MIALPGQAKLLIVVAAMLPAPIGQTLGETHIPADEIACVSVQPFIVDTNFYQTRTRTELTALGRDDDPVGLYYLAQRDLKAGRNAAAHRKLNRAADAGLPDAHARLAELHAARKDVEAARKAMFCADLLQMRAETAR